ncbi:MAG: hypothetical protein R2788_21300 [Saprospiraceae bacterium]
MDTASSKNKFTSFLLGFLRFAKLVKTDSYKKHIALAAFLSLFLFSCGNSTSPLDQFHKEFRRKLDRATLRDFKKTKEKELRYEMYPLLAERAINTLLSNAELNDQINSHGTLTENVKAFVLMVSFHRVLNDKDVRFVELIEEFDHILKEDEKYYARYDECDRKKEEFAQANLINWGLGDTLSLQYPVYTRDNIRNAFYYVCPSEYSSDTSEFLTLKGVLIKKDTVSYYNGDKDWRFYLRVLDLSDSITNILLQHIVIDDTIQVDLKGYGRLIE